MAQLLDIFGFLSVLLRGLTLSLQALVVGGIVFRFVIAKEAANERFSLRLVRWSVIGFAVVQMAYLAADSAILTGTTDLSAINLLGANFFISGIIAITAAILMALSPMTEAFLPVFAAGAIAIVSASVSTSHAAARLDDRWILLALDWLHQAAAACWIGGLPYLLISLSSAESSDDTRKSLTTRFSNLAAGSVAMLFLAGLGLSYFYISPPSTVYGTTYGWMVMAKVVLFGIILLVGTFNYFVVRAIKEGRPVDGTLFHLRRFSEVEIGIGFTVLLAAASLTSIPPAVDLQSESITIQEIGARMKPRMPRFESPSSSELSPVTPLAFGEAANRLDSYVPGVVYTPQNEADIAWSEYNHHWAGFVLLAIGLLSFLSSTGVGWAKHWPICFFGLGAFLLLRSDSENWPLGPRGFWESFAVAEVAQHRIFVLLICAFAIFEWRVRTGRAHSGWQKLVFPAVCALGGALLLTHTHSLGNIKEELFAEMSHISLAMLGIVAGWSRWLEIRNPDWNYRRALSFVWPTCFFLVGVILVLYRES